MIEQPNAVVPLHRSSQSMPPPQDALEAHALVMLSRIKYAIVTGTAEPCALVNTEC